MSSNTETIAAIATAAGAGGVGIVRLSGPLSYFIAKTITSRELTPRTAHYAKFTDNNGDYLDDGIALYFPAPNSFTGEEVVELQAHGSPVVLQQLVARACELGARSARPGEFSERAFINGKLDLAQAEAIADLINAADSRSARAARRSLEGVFSQRVNEVSEKLLHLRIHIEAAIDFVDEPIETLGLPLVSTKLNQTHELLELLLKDAERGRKLRDGLHVVLIGPPNAGKSSLLNVLAGSDRAIVTQVAGTTRDILRESIRLDGLELTLVDTAGLREGGDAIEQEGMRRARNELQQADLALIVIDASNPEAGKQAVLDDIAHVPQKLWVYNKADLLKNIPENSHLNNHNSVYISANTGYGLPELQYQLRELGLGQNHSGEGEFSARTRHVNALKTALFHTEYAISHLHYEQLELAAEELRLAHNFLGEITGRISADEMLGHIFSTFCIGK